MTRVKIEVKLHIFPTPSSGGNEISAIGPDRLITGNYKAGSKIVTSTRVRLGHWNLLPVSGMEPRFPHRAVGFLVTMLTELS